MQATVVKGEKCNLKRVLEGIPQGSVFGPLLFLIYINDIVDSIESILKWFADDTEWSRLTGWNTEFDLEKMNEWAPK